MPAAGPDRGARAWAALHPDDRAWLASLAAQAGVGARVALVGGAVRDALLGRTPLDLDVVLEGADVEGVARATGRPVTFHPAFQNATVTLPDGRGADLVRARRESYPAPGQNPVPELGTLDDDLRRRDFGLNALALVVRPEGGAELHDVVGGLGDLARRELRPLHPRSFHEDASRAARGARLAARLDLAPHPELLAQMADALAMADATPRLWAELKLLLAEPRPGHAARLLTDWGAGAWLGDPALLEALDVRQAAGETVTPQTYAAAALATASDPAALAVRLGLGDKPGALLARALGDTFFPERTAERQLRALLRPGAYTPLTGKDVLALGAVPGRGVGEALAHLAGLRRAGQVSSAEEERAALAAYLRPPT